VLLWNLQLIRVFRKQKQAHIAAESGLDQPYISRLEMGAPVRDVADIDAIARALGVSAQSLVADAVVLYKDGRVEAVRESRQGKESV
jgi:transcriptional regulator with XRE-family HTH domain